MLARSPSDPIADLPPDAVPDFDPTVLATLPMVADGSMPGFALEMLAMFETTSAAALAAFDAALAAADRSTAMRQVHSLKSSSAQIGALALAEAAARCEKALRGDADDGTRWSPLLRDRHAAALAALRAARGAYDNPDAGSTRVGAGR